MKKAIEKMNEMKSWFSDTFSQTHQIKKRAKLKSIKLEIIM